MSGKSPRPPLSVWIAAVLGTVSGGWMIFDGMHAIVRGDYVRMDGQLGPWAAVVEKAGAHPQSMRYPFVLLGLLWLIASAGLVARRKWCWRLGLGMSVISLFYFFIGTALSLITLVLLSLRPTRQYISARGSNGSAG